MFGDSFGSTRRLQQTALPSLAAQIDDIGLKLLRKFQRGKFQFFDVEEHGETSAAITPTSPREHAKEA